MAHTIDDLIISIADKYSHSTDEYFKYKKMLWEIVDELHNPVYLEKLIEDKYNEI